MAVFGTFEYGSSTVYGTDPSSSTVESIDVLDANKIRVVFSGDVVVDDNLLDPNNYVIEFADNLGFTDVDTIKVFPAVPKAESDSVQSNLVSTRYVELLTKYHAPGQSYRITITNIRAADGTIVAERALDATARRTKVDNILADAPSHIDTRPGANARALLVALGLEDDRIGGSLRELIIPDALEPPLLAAASGAFIETANGFLIIPN